MDSIKMKTFASTIFKHLAADGLHWKRQIQAGDPRNDIFFRKVDEEFNIEKNPDKIAFTLEKIFNLLSTGNRGGECSFYLRPCNTANRSCWASIINVAVSTPDDEKTKTAESSVKLIFHLIFIKPAQTKERVVIGYRIESPEILGTEHRYYHAQPIVKFKGGAPFQGAFHLQPDTFPAFPILAESPKELLMALILIASGTDAISNISRERKLGGASNDAKEYLSKVQKSHLTISAV